MDTKSPNITVIRLLFTRENWDFNETEYLWTIFHASRQAGLLLQASCVSESLTAVSNVVPEMCVKVKKPKECVKRKIINRLRISTRPTTWPRPFSGNKPLLPSWTSFVFFYSPFAARSLPFATYRTNRNKNNKKNFAQKVAVVTREKLEMCIECSLECKWLSCLRSPRFARAKWWKKFDNRPESLRSSGRSRYQHKKFVKFASGFVSNPVFDVNRHLARPHTINSRLRKRSDIPTKTKY